MVGTDPRARASSAQYDLLPTTEKGITFPFSSTRFGLKRRRNIIVSVALISTSVLVFLYLLYNRPAPGSLEAALESTDQPLPPLYSKYHEAELALPHQDLKHPFAGGKKYMWSADHVQCRFTGRCSVFHSDVADGFSSVWIRQFHARHDHERRACLSHEAHVSSTAGYVNEKYCSRANSFPSLVFDNFTWDRDGGDYAQFNGHIIPSRIPLSALISGGYPVFHPSHRPARSR